MTNLGNNSDNLVQHLQQCKAGQVFGPVVYNNLPEVVQAWIDLYEEDYQRDFFLLGALPVIGGLLYNTTFTYRNGKTYYPNWNSIIVAPPGSNKGIMAKAGHLMDNFKYDNVPFNIPGDLSSAGLLKLLGKMDGIGCILETEIDSLSKATEQKWGDHSDIFRKTFENEMVSKMRASDEVPLVVPNPRFSVAISGTPDQVAPLISGHENGLFSRFCFYLHDGKAHWQNWSDQATERQFEWLKSDLDYYGLALYESQGYGPYKALFTDECIKLINKAGNSLFTRYSEDQGLVASVFRSIVMAMKIAVGLSFLRQLETMQPDDPLEVHENDLIVGLAIVGVSMANAQGEIHTSRETKLKPERRNFFRHLPRGCSFTTQQALEIGSENHLKERAVYDHLNFLLGQNMLIKHGKGVYSVNTQ